MSHVCTVGTLNQCEACGYYDYDASYAWIVVFIMIMLVFCAFASCSSWAYGWYEPERCTCYRRRAFDMRPCV